MVELDVCIGSACHLKGSYNVIQTFQHLIEEKQMHDKIRFKATFCMNVCQNKGVSVAVNGRKYDLSPEKAEEFFEDKILSEIK